MLPQYLTHNAGVNFAAPYLNSTMLAQQWGKPFLLFETNTASCGGFPGISDTFTSALWGIDHAMQLAHSNFSGALFHFGGQNVSYNVSSVHKHQTDLALTVRTALHGRAYERVGVPGLVRRPHLLQCRVRRGGDGPVEHDAAQRHVPE